MGNYFLDLTGQRFGKLVAIECVGSNKHKVRLWKCKCDCGNETIVISQSLKLGNTKSCGCLWLSNAESLPPHRRSRKHAKTVCGIYKVTNPNGEVYIGSSRNIYRRWLRHREGRKNLDFHKSIKLFGWKNHNWEIICELPLDISEDILLKYEQFCIDQYKEANICLLNKKDAGSKGKFSDESKKRMSKTRVKPYEFLYNGEVVKFVGLKQYCKEHNLGERQMSQVFNNNGWYGDKNYYRGYSRVK